MLLTFLRQDRKGEKLDIWHKDGPLGDDEPKFMKVENVAMVMLKSGNVDFEALFDHEEVGCFNQLP